MNKSKLHKLIHQSLLLKPAISHFSAFKLTPSISPCIKNIFFHDLDRFIQEDGALTLRYVLENTVMSKDKKYTVRFRVWIDEEEGPFLGIGRVILLQKIQETGSITNAAKSIKMSYRKAWQLVEDMNKRAEKPLVEK